MNDSKYGSWGCKAQKEFSVTLLLQLSKAGFEQSILTIIQKSSVVMSNLQSCFKLMKYSISFIFGLLISHLSIIPENKNISSISMDF